MRLKAINECRSIMVLGIRTIRDPRKENKRCCSDQVMMIGSEGICYPIYTSGGYPLVRPRCLGSLRLWRAWNAPTHFSTLTLCLAQSYAPGKPRSGSVDRYAFASVLAPPSATSVAKLLLLLRFWEYVHTIACDLDLITQIMYGTDTRLGLLLSSPGMVTGNARHN